MEGNDVYQRAQSLIEEYGADASTHAAQKAEQMLDLNDFEAFAMWKRIGRAILELRRAHGEH